jgi:hypothetical protein
VGLAVGATEGRHEGDTLVVLVGVPVEGNRVGSALGTKVEGTRVGAFDSDVGLRVGFALGVDKHARLGDAVVVPHVDVLHWPQP